MSLGERVQRLRKKDGLSQEQLSEKLKVSRQAISKWELDETIPDVENIIQLSQIFDVPSDYLLGIELESISNTDREKNINETEKIFKRLRVLSICLVIVGFGTVLMIWLITILSPVVVYHDENNYSGGFSAFLEYYNLSIFNSSMIAMGIVGAIVFIVASAATYARRSR